MKVSWTPEAANTAEKWSICVPPALDKRCEEFQRQYNSQKNKCCQWLRDNKWSIIEWNGLLIWNGMVAQLWGKLSYMFSRTANATCHFFFGAQTHLTLEPCIQRHKKKKEWCWPIGMNTHLKANPKGLNLKARLTAHCERVSELDTWIMLKCWMNQWIESVSIRIQRWWGIWSLIEINGISTQHVTTQSQLTLIQKNERGESQDYQ